MKDKNIKIIALDLDGTTLNSEKKISKRTREAFKAAMEKNVHIVISTGRTFMSLPKQLFEIEGLEYAVTSNGAMITKIPEKKIIYENYIFAESVEQIVEKLRGTGISVETFVHGKAYIDKEEFNNIRQNGSTYRDTDYVLTTRNPITNIYDFMIENKEIIENISINFESDKDKHIIEEILSNIKNVTITSSFSHNFEIGGATTSKAEALTELMKKLSLHRSQLMACGDSPNDLEMIKLAEVGVVVGNASDSMKKKADYVTDTNNRDGVAKAIEKFVL